MTGVQTCALPIYGQIGSGVGCSWQSDWLRGGSFIGLVTMRNGSPEWDGSVRMRDGSAEYRLPA